MDNSSPKIVQLIAYDKDEKLQYEGRCKVIIDTLSNLMLIEPFNEEFKLISALFTWNFVAQKNMLFVFSNIESQDFALIFNDNHRCQKVYDILLKKGANSGNKELIHDRFLPSLLNEISKNDETTSKMKAILAEWIERHNGKEKEDLIQLLKDNNVYDLIFPGGCIRSRKRKLCSDVSAHIGENQSCKKVNSPNFVHGSKNHINETTNFEICDYVIKGKTKQKIIVYTSSAQTHCYEYKRGKKAYRCGYCLIKGKSISAKIIQKNGKSVVKFIGNEHICDGLKVIQKPLFEMVTFNSNTRIIVYKDSELTQCYHYSWYKKSSETYNCTSCQSLKCCYITAAICQRKDGTEFVTLNPRDHVCKARENKFMITKRNYFTGKQQIIEAPNFEMLKFFHNKEEKKPWIIVFLDDSHKKCYEYSWNAQLKSYDCLGCQQNKQHRSTAKLCQKDDGTKYVVIYPESHICKARTFNRDKFFDAEKQIVKAPNYEIKKYIFDKKETSKLLIFASSDKSFFYEYTCRITENMFQCCGCNTKKHRASAKICHFDDGTEYVKLGKSKHVCEPRKYYSTIMYQEIVEKPNFEVKEQKDAEGRNLSKLFIYTSSEKTTCYEFYLESGKKTFFCCECSNKKKSVAAKILQHDNGTDYVILSKSEHVCTPRETKTFEFDFSNEIVESPNFKILKYQHKGKEHSKLVLFCLTNKNLCYDYFWMPTKKIFMCSRCPFENRVNAIICKNAVGKEYLQLENSNHTCELHEFDPEKYKDDAIIKKPMYQFVEYTFRKEKKTALIIFAGPDKKFCYSMYYRKDRKEYYCTKCCKLKVWIIATVQNYGKDDEFIYASNQKHICKPEKYSAMMKSKKMKKL